MSIKPTKTSAKPDDRKRALDTALAAIERQFGKGAVMRVGGDSPVVAVETISSGSLGLDIALGVGGLPRGRIVEIYGPESSGKTTLTLHVLAEAQKKGLTCAFVDAEHALDVQYAAKLGVNLEDLLISQPSTGEEGLNITETLARSGAIDVIVVDSVAALTPQKELEGDVGDSQVGVQARMMSQAMRKLTGVVSKHNVLLIFINQIRMKIGVMFGCFHHDQRVMLADGTSRNIGDIVTQRLPVEVLSFNGQTGAIEPKRVVNWFDNGLADAFLRLTITSGGEAPRVLDVTENHTIFTPEGEVSAGDLKVGDTVLAVRAADGTITTIAETIQGIESMPASDRMNRYDLEVEGNHSYLVDGVVVHNSPETTTGGNALKFYASVRLDIRRTGSLKDRDEVVGNTTRVKVVKNKVAPPFRQAEFDIMFGKGISKAGEIIDLGVAANVVEKSGAWYSYNSERIGQGKEKVRDFLISNPAIADDIEAKIRENATPITSTGGGDDDTPANSDD